VIWLPISGENVSFNTFILQGILSFPFHRFFQIETVNGDINKFTNRFFISSLRIFFLPCDNSMDFSGLREAFKELNTAPLVMECLAAF